MNKIRITALILTSTLPLAALAQSDFVPLLPTLPGIKDFSSSSSVPTLLNTIYKYSIGAAAVIAVLQLVRAGIMYMGGDSVTEKREAKNLIGMTIGGLLLVLSPVIVFTIINPDILKLQIGTSSLEPLDSFSGTIDTALWGNVNGDRASDANRCAQSGGTIQYECSVNGAWQKVSATTQCAEGASSRNVCLASGGSPTAESQCTANYTNITAVESTGNNTCSAQNGYVGVPNGCCQGASASTLCCAKPKSQYVFAAHFTQTTNASCVSRRTPQYYPTLALCQQAKASFQNYLASPASNVTYSNVVIEKDCELVAVGSYQQPVPENSCSS